MERERIYRILIPVTVFQEALYKGSYVKPPTKQEILDALGIDDGRLTLYEYVGDAEIIEEAPFFEGSPRGEKRVLKDENEEPKKRYMIWGNYDLGELNVWKDYLKEKGLMDENEMTQHEAIAGMNMLYFDDERQNLDKELGYQIVKYGTKGYWGGAKSGSEDATGNYLKEGSYSDNLNAILEFEKDCEYAEWYVEDGELKSRQSHHDGQVNLTYRVLTTHDIDDFELALQKNFQKAIKEYTRSLAPDVAAVYGWDIADSEQ